MPISDEIRLRNFVKTVERLEKNKFFPNCLTGTLYSDVAVSDSIGITLSDVKITLTMTGVAFDELVSFLVTFRRFTLEQDEVYLNKVYKAALRIARGSKVERWIRLSKRRTRHAEDFGYPQAASLNGTTKPLEFFKLWIYGNPDLFHQDEDADQPKIWERIKPDQNQRAIVEAMALQFIRKMSKELLHLKKLICGFLSGQDEGQS